MWTAVGAIYRHLGNPLLATCFYNLILIEDASVIELSSNKTIILLILARVPALLHCESREALINALLTNIVHKLYHVTIYPMYF